MGSEGRRAESSSRSRRGAASPPIAPPRPGSTVEHTVARLHPSARRLTLPALLVVGVAAAAGYAFGLVAEPWQRAAVVAAAALLVVLVGVLPFLFWASHVHLVTTRRVVVTRGLVRRTRRELLHSRANRLELTRSPLQRLAGSGDIVAYQGEREVLRLTDVPSAPLVEETLLDFMEFAGGGTLARSRQSDDTRRPFDPPAR